MIKNASPHPNNFVLNAIKRVLSSGQYVKGPEVEIFEANFQTISGCKYNIAVNSGTSALNIILAAADYPVGSEIIVPTNTFLATGNAVETTGYNTKFIDIDPNTMNLDITQLQDKITSSTKAILVVHLYGIPCNMREIMAIAKKYNIDVYEDACQAHGATINGKLVGTFGKASAYSLFPTKNLTVLGDGGMISTNDERLALKMKALRNAGRTDASNNADYFGYNMRLSEILAGVGNAMLIDFDENTEMRRAIARHYSEELCKIEQIRMPIILQNAKPVWHQFTILVDDRDDLKKYLKSRNISSTVNYSIPLHLVNSFAKKYNTVEGDYPVSEKLAKQLLCLPIHPKLTYAEIESIIDEITKFYS